MKFTSLLEKQAKHYPSKTAIFDGSSKYTFSELETLSSGFAKRLLSSGLTKGDRVIFCAKKSANLVIAIIGCLKAGCVFVPVDTEITANRLNYIISEINPGAIICSQSTLMKTSINLANTQHVLDSKLSEYFSSVDNPNSPDDIFPEDIAYCIYTSGSTGNPKGVTISHGNVNHFFDAMLDVMPLNETSRCMNTSALYFDVCIMDIFYPLYCGAYLYLYCERVVAEKFLAIIHREHITHFTAVGPIITLLSQSPHFLKANLTSVSRFLTGAEIINVDAIQAWLKKIPGLTIVNGYGPTEATVICSYHEITQVETKRTEFYPIGRAMPGSKLLLLDEDNRVSEPGHAGELFIGGPQVMLGYWNNQAITKQAIREIDGERYYRSGDICQWLPDGNLHYLGRRDEEVKISGFRIHLNEIKKLADSFIYIEEAYSLVLQHAKLGKVICLCFSEKPQANDPKGDIFKSLKSDLKSNLPYYMLPSLYFLFRELPRLPSGKTDKKIMRSILEKIISKSDQLNTTFVFENNSKEMV